MSLQKWSAIKYFIEIMLEIQHFREIVSAGCSREIDVLMALLRKPDVLIEFVWEMGQG